ncbi:MAG: extracellular solute-binding protein [Dehalococcoidia bacterium]|nr:extracellular solute-binding protein [Dehalococcoidia bacterium]
MMLRARMGIGIVAILGMVALLVACAPAAAPTATPAPKATAAPPPAATPTAPAAKPSPKPSALEQLIEGSRKEGVVRANLSSSLGEKGAQRLTEALNKKYDLNLKLEYTPAVKMEAVVAQVVTELQTGGAPSFDILNGTLQHFMDMRQRGMLSTFDWVGAFPHVPRELVFFDGGWVGFASEYNLPAYNPNLVKPADAPRKWEDLLDPKWKGKLVMHNSVSAWIRLTETWGEEKVTALLQGLAKQDPVFVSAPQVVPRVTSGEYPLAAPVLASMFFDAQAKGAPIRFAEEVKPMVSMEYGLVVPQRAKNPNAARLLVAFTLTPEAQRIWWEEGKFASSLVPGPLADFVKGKDVATASLDFVTQNQVRLEDKYLKLVGLK